MYMLCFRVLEILIHMYINIVPKCKWSMRWTSQNPEIILQKLCTDAEFIQIIQTRSKFLDNNGLCIMIF